jgi:hypothetical protein
MGRVPRGPDHHLYERQFEKPAEQGSFRTQRQLADVQLNYLLSRSV